MNDEDNHNDGNEEKHKKKRENFFFSSPYPSSFLRQEYMHNNRAIYLKEELFDLHFTNRNIGVIML